MWVAQIDNIKGEGEFKQEESRQGVEVEPGGRKLVGWPIGCVMLRGGGGGGEVSFQRLTCQRSFSNTSRVENKESEEYLHLIRFRVCSHPCLYERVHSALKIHSLAECPSIIIPGLGSRRHFFFPFFSVSLLFFDLPSDCYHRSSL